MHVRAVNRVVFIWVLLVIIVALLGKVSVAAPNAGQTAADFLLIGVGAGASGMGGAYSAVSSGASSLYWNPAGMTGADRAEISLSHFAWYQDITLEHGALSFPISDRLAVGASVTFLNYGTIDGYDANGVSTGDLSAYDWAGGLSLGYSLTDNLSCGVTGKFINEKLATVSASTYAADLGLKFQSTWFAAAAVISNAGPFMKFDQYNEQLPTSGRLALSFMPLGSRVVTSLEYEKRAHGDVVIRNGIQLGFSDQYFLRGGYSYYPSDELRRFGTGFSLGAGLRLSRATVDYAYTTKDSYTSEDLHRFSLTVALGK